jgi:hypothetical protein
MEPPPPAGTKKSLFDNLDFSKPPPGLFPAGVSPSCPIPSSGNTNEENLVPPGTETEEQLSSQIKDGFVNTLSSLSAPESPPPPSKPSIDLFKEIFANSSSESEEEEPPAPKPSSSSSLPKTKESWMRRDDKNERTKDKSESNAQAKGIFDNLDFSKLGGPKSTSTGTGGSDSQSRSRETYKDIKESDPSIKPSFVPRESNRISDEEDIYGPSLPAHPTGINSKTSSIPILSSKAGLEPIIFPHISQDKEEEEEVVWVEKTDERDSASKKKLHHHKKKKSKHHHHHKSKTSKKVKKRKSKSKSKKDKSRRSSSSSDVESSSSEDDNDLSAIRIHQSLSSKAILSKLKEITQLK